MKTEILTVDFSEIYKLYHDGKLTNYKDVPFRTKEKQEALQYVENVANYLTGTPWKGKQNPTSVHKVFMEPHQGIWSAKKQRDFLLSIMKNLDKYLTESPVKKHVIAVDLDFSESDSIRVTYLLSNSERSSEKWVNYTQCCNWNYVFPVKGSWQINQNINYLWVGFDGVQRRVNGVIQTIPCPISQRCSNLPYEIDRIMEYANNYIMNNPYVANGQYYINLKVKLKEFDHFADSCIRSRSDVQTFINISAAYVFCQGVTSPIKNTSLCPLGKKFIASDIWHVAGPCKCSCYKDKWLKGDYWYGNITNVPPSL